MPSTRLPALPARIQPLFWTLAALIAGLCYPLAFAPYRYVALILVSIALLWWVLQQQTAKAAWWLGFVYGVGQFGLGVSWVYVSVHTFGKTGWLASSVLTVLFVSVLALFPAFTCWLSQRVSGSRRFYGSHLSPIYFIASWLFFDWLRSWIFTGFPWLYAGYAAIDSPLAKLAPYGGVWLVTLAVLLTGVTFGFLLTRRWHVAVPLFAAIAWLAAFFLPALPGVHKVGEPQPVALVQANIAQSVKWKPEQQAETRKVYAGLMETIKDKSALVIWSESALTEFYRAAKPWLKEQAKPFVAQGGALVTGLPRYILGVNLHPIFFNSLVVVGGGHGIYNKQKLVPFGEFVPLAGVLRGLLPFFNLPMSSFTAGGPHQKNLTVQGWKAAPIICYDAIYPRVVARQAKGSNVLLEVSDDAWFGTSAGPWQHFQIERMRALETGRYLLRDTNNGVTAIVDARGRVVSALPQFVRGVLKGSYQPMTGQTPFMGWGRWLTLIIVLVLLGVELVWWRRKK